MIMVDDDRLPLKPGEKPEMRRVRFRTLGCYPLTGAVESNATTLPEIIQEMLLTKFSERQGRLIDHDEAGSMEKKKKEGYFYLRIEVCAFSKLQRASAAVASSRQIMRHHRVDVRLIAVRQHATARFAVGLQRSHRPAACRATPKIAEQ